MRRVRSVVAAGCAAVALLAGAVAPAQAAPGGNAAAVADLVKIVNGNVANANCDVLRLALRGAGMVGPETTRGQLVKTVNTTIGQDAALRLVTAPTVNALGDRALACGIVKPDPVTPLDQAIEMSSKLSSQAGLPEARNLMAALPR